MCKTHKIAEELNVKLLKHLQGAEVLDVPEHGALPEGSYLVERDGEMFVLKTGKFNPREVDDNWEMAEMGVRTRMVFETQPDEYILYEYIEAPLLSSEDFWSDEKMQKVFDLHTKIEAGLAERSMTQEEIVRGMEWITNKPLGAWLDESGDAWSKAEVAKLRETLAEDWDLVWVYRDNNGDHYLELGNELAVVDADISIRPRHYMDMRYLAWVILKMPMDALSLDWVKGWVQRLGDEPPRLRTFLLSLIGVMWDIHRNEKHKGEHAEKTELIKEIINWVLEEATND